MSISFSFWEVLFGSFPNLLGNFNSLLFLIQFLLNNWVSTLEALTPFLLSRLSQRPRPCCGLWPWAQSPASMGRASSEGGFFQRETVVVSMVSGLCPRGATLNWNPGLRFLFVFSDGPYGEESGLKFERHPDTSGQESTCMYTYILPSVSKVQDGHSPGGGGDSAQPQAWGWCMCDPSPRLTLDFTSCRWAPEAWKQKAVLNLKGPAFM